MNPWDQRFESLLRAALRDLADDQELTPDLSMVDVGLTSFAAVELLLRIQAAYSIAVPEELLNFTSFSTPGTLWTLVSKVLGSG
ncbi:acyl carrier protein [Catenulispora sp. GAS73]|uniref:phosphopantetheine-binding protein n=1 Tax=Catenulispora sp. GAS73 TaxID=3156269 RepID=UPI003514E7F2